MLDVSPGQGEFLKASLASRTKAIAICGTEVHGSRLELLLTEYILSELSREGSTFYRPESVAKDEDETKKENKIDEAGSKKRPKNAAKPNPVEKKRRKNKDEENLEETKDEETEVKKTTNKKAKKNKQEDEQQDGEDSDEKSSECWWVQGRSVSSQWPHEHWADQLWVAWGSRPILGWQAKVLPFDIRLLDFCLLESGTWAVWAIDASDMFCVKSFGKYSQRFPWIPCVNMSEVDLLLCFWVLAQTWNFMPTLRFAHCSWLRKQQKLRCNQPQQRWNPWQKSSSNGELAEIGALALQLVCIADDLDDKFDEDPGLLEKMSVSREDVGRTMRFLRKLSDKARAAQSQVQEELVGMVGPDAATTDTQPEPTAAAEPGGCRCHWAMSAYQ